MENLDPILTVPEVAEYLKVSKAKIYYLIQQGKIPYIRIGRNVRIKETDLKIWIEQRTVKQLSFWPSENSPLAL